jgi:hypothetical protein
VHRGPSDDRATVRADIRCEQATSEDCAGGWHPVEAAVAVEVAHDSRAGIGNGRRQGIDSPSNSMNSVLSLALALIVGSISTRVAITLRMRIVVSSEESPRCR